MVDYIRGGSKGAAPQPTGAQRVGGEAATRLETGAGGTSEGAQPWVNKLLEDMPRLELDFGWLSPTPSLKPIDIGKEILDRAPVVNLHKMYYELIAIFFLFRCRLRAQIRDSLEDTHNVSFLY